MALRIGQAHLASLERHARLSRPIECCGLLVGCRRGSDLVVDRAIPCRNISQGDRRRRYQIDWSILGKTLRASRLGQGEIVAFYHSHPDGSRRPSRHDTDLAWSDYAYVIVSVPSCGFGSATIGCWRMPADRGGFVAETIVSV